MGVQRGYEVHVVDLATEGPKRDLVEALGAHYHAGDAADVDADVDVVIECTGLGGVGRSAAQRVVSGGIICLTGIMNVEPQFDVDATTMNRNVVLRNLVLFGTVNAGPAPLGAGRRRARDRRSGLVAGDDHPARAAHSLDRRARTPAARHQSRRRSHGMTASSAVPWSETPGRLSEGPRWHEERQELLWVDILGRQLHRGTLAGDGSLDDVVTISLDRHVGAVAPALAGGYVVAAGPGFLFVDENGSVHELAQPEAGRAERADERRRLRPSGRFWAGTMAYDESPAARGRSTASSSTAAAPPCSPASRSPTASAGAPTATRCTSTTAAQAASNRSASIATTAAITNRRTLYAAISPASCPTASPWTRTTRYRVALGRRGGQPLRARRVAPRQPRVAGRATHLVRLRRARPGDAVHDHLPGRTRRRRTGPAARLRARVRDLRPRRPRAPVPALPRTNPEGRAHSVTGKPAR